MAILFALPPGGIVLGGFVGGLTALLACAGLARLAPNTGNVGLVLSGVIVAAFFAALISLAEINADALTFLPSIVYWLLGSFSTATPQKVLMIGIPTAIASAALLAVRWRINLLALSDDDARLLGVPVTALRWTVAVCASLAVASQVAVSGGVGWVGLVIPHAARMLVGPDHRRLLPASALLGACFLLGVDDLGRSFSTQEIPVGVMTAVIGTPAFAFIFWRTQGRGWNRE